jgi:hypothetical protein
MARNYSSTVEPKTLTANITSNTATQITLNNVTNLPSPPYVLVINPDTAKEEVVLVTVDQTGVTSPTLKVTRAIEAKDGVGVARSDHTIGDTVKHMIVGSDLQIVHDHFSNDNTTTGTAHGATGGVVGRTNSQTLTNKTIDLTDNTLRGTKAEFNASLEDGDFATISGTETLTNKTLTSPVVTGGTLNGGVALTVDSTELNILDGATLSTAELNLLDGVTATTTELNYIDGVTSAIQPQIDGKSGTAHTHPYVSTSGGTVSGSLDVQGVVSAVTNTGAGRGLHTRQPSGDTDPALIQFTNNAATEQRASIGASTAGQLTATASVIYLSSTNAYWNGVYNTVVSASANVLSSSDMQLRRTSSSARYKKDIETLEHEVADRVLDLRPVWFKAKESNTDNPEQWSYVGLIAEEVAEVEPRLVFYKTVEVNYDENGNVITGEDGKPTYETLETPVPESVQYEKVAVYLLDVVKREKARSNDLEQRLIALEAKVTELEAK